MVTGFVASHGWLIFGKVRFLISAVTYYEIDGLNVAIYGKFPKDREYRFTLGSVNAVNNFEFEMMGMFRWEELDQHHVVLKQSGCV